MITGTASKTVLAYIQRHAVRSGFSNRMRNPIAVPARPPIAWNPNAPSTMLPRIRLGMLSEMIRWAVG